jgi:alanyl aminopeptidase
MRHLGALSVSALLVACSASPPLTQPPPALTAQPSATAATPDPSPPTSVRLPAGATPKKITATLTLDPSADTFEGESDLDLTFEKASRMLWLNATEMQVSEAWLEVNGKRIAARVIPGGDDFIGFVFAEEAPIGAAKLHTKYTGHVSGRDDRGVFREEEAGMVFLFSQFENIEARRAFPCFDEPSFKHPWQLTLRVKATDVALSNTPVLEDKADAATSSSKPMHTVRFAETKPLPAYLVAFAVGPFDLVDAGKAGKNQTPIRIAVPRGRAADAAYAKATTPKQLELLETYFGMPYPYEKLDIVSVPNLVSFGAMENVGLITCAASRTIARPAEDTPKFRHDLASTFAHEMAHQWFGDLVTTAWWDDIWLNEGFATWTENKITHRFDPSFGTDLGMVQDASRVMEEDGLVSARKVRQEILSKDDIANAFDGITYQKGGATLDMFESYLGEAAFQKGVRHYLEKFSHKNATSNDFITALGEGAGVADPAALKAAFSTFLDQPGVPLVSAELTCSKDSAKLALKQERYAPVGSKVPSSLWQIPICVRYGAGKESGRACTMFGAASGELALPKLPKAKSACPDWVMPKAEGHGYYRVAYSAKTIDALLGKQKDALSQRERLSVIGDVDALVSSGKLPVGDALARVPELLKDPNAFVRMDAVSITGWIRPDQLEPALRPKALAYFAKTFAPLTKQVGLRPKPGESAEERKLRAQIWARVADREQDPKLIAEALPLLDAWLADPKSLEQDAVNIVLELATAHGDKKLFDKLHAALKGEKETRRRSQLLRGLAAFADPVLRRAALELLLTSEVEAREGLALLFGDDHGGDVTWEFFKKNFDALMARIPAEVRPWAFEIGSVFCDAGHRADVAAFTKDHAAGVIGGQRIAAQSLESIDLCIARREANRESIKKFLK